MHNHPLSLKGREFMLIKIKTKDENIKLALSALSQGKRIIGTLVDKL